jgi:hypothetical protein
MLDRPQFAKLSDADKQKRHAAGFCAQQLQDADISPTSSTTSKQANEINTKQLCIASDALGPMLSVGLTDLVSTRVLQAQYLRTVLCLGEQY